MWQSLPATTKYSLTPSLTEWNHRIELPTTLESVKHENIEKNFYGVGLKQKDYQRVLQWKSVRVTAWELTL